MFIEYPANVMSLSRRKLVQGKGINDADYKVYYKDSDNKRHRCPYYLKWLNMLARAYCPKSHVKYPSYVGSSVCEEWLTFSVFKAWMETQNWEDRDLDKDLIDWKNKVYSPETCLFIPQELNKLLALRNSCRGEYPLGVSFQKSSKRFVASLGRYGKGGFLGLFMTFELAHEAYKVAKLEYIQELAQAESDPRIKEALLNLA